jgi:hypothetical protein
MQSRRISDLWIDTRCLQTLTTLARHAAQVALMKCNLQGELMPSPLKHDDKATALNALPSAAK